MRQRGKATVDVLADVMGGLLRDLTFPKQMRWDAYLEDGKGDLVFARPIRWLVLLYGGRVVPFVIRRTELAQGPNVQDIRSGVQHLRPPVPDDERPRRPRDQDQDVRGLRERACSRTSSSSNRAERESKIRRELETHARKLGGRVSGLVAAQSSLLQEVPDLVEYPSVVAGHFPVEFLQLPEEVLTTTMIHHQHYFPVVDDEGKLKPAFLAVTNMQPEKPEIIARNSERVLTARLRDARFFWDEDRKAPLESRIDRLATILFHKKLGSYREKADRVAALAAWIAAEALEAPGRRARTPSWPAGSARPTWPPTWCASSPSCRARWAASTRARKGKPEEVWKAIYYHYLPVGVEADAPPSRQQLGARGGDVGGRVAGRQARLGRRDVHGGRAPDRLARSARPPAAGAGRGEDPRRPAELTGIDARVPLGPLLARAAEPFGGYRRRGGAAVRVHAPIAWRTCSSSAASTSATSAR